jgi:hypothetical protein
MGSFISIEKEEETTSCDVSERGEGGDFLGHF